LSKAEGYKVVYHGVKDLRVEPFGEIPKVKDGEMLIEVEACAICGSDVKTFKLGNPRMNAPATIGHEFCGTIIDLGKGVDKYSIGERVTMATTMGCGECIYCKQGKTNICKNITAMGFHCDGAMAAYTVVPAKAVSMGNVVKVGDLDAQIAALSEPMSCAINGLGRLPMDKIESALIVGIGALGMMHAIALSEYGVKNIVCVSNPGVKRDIMEDIGYKVIGRDELDKEYLELSGGDGFDLVIITAPSNAVQANAVQYAKKGGYVSYFASLPVGDEMLNMNSRTIHYNELILYGTSDSTAAHVKEAGQILRKRKDTFEKIITTMPIQDFQTGLDGILDKSLAKVVLIP
jgi:L-iditol 2-dehydrogenase